MRTLATIVLSSLLAVAARLAAADCNGNGRDDAQDVAPGRLGFRPLGKVQLRAFGIRVELADFNRDGKLDAAVLQQEPGKLAVLLSEGGWRLAPPISLTPDDRPLDLAVADLDGDGDPDAAVAGSLTIQLFINPGNGRLEARRSVPIGSGPRQVLAGDVNADGLVDLVTINHLDGGELDNVSVFLNQAGGELEQPRNYASGSNAREGVAADADGDGDSDLLRLADAGAEVLVLGNDGKGAFAESVPRSRVGSHASRIAAGDLDGDGDPDLVMTYSIGDVTLLFNQGGGQFAHNVDLPDGAGDRRALVRDLNGDGRSDLAIPGRDCTTVCVLLNAGGEPESIFRERIAVEVGGLRADLGLNMLGEVRAGDLDGDGDLDLAVLAPFGITLLSQELAGDSADCDRNGVPDECETDCNGSHLPDACDIALGSWPDCDRNGIPDECDPDCDTSGTPDACDLAGGAAPDCNRNGIPDVCDVPDANQNWVPDDCDLATFASLDCNGNGVPDDADLEPVVALPHRAVAGRSGVGALTSGDFDGDGIPDLLIGQRGISCLRGARAPASLLGSRPYQATDAFAFAYALTAADFNGDGDLDAAFAGAVEACREEKAAVFTLENLGRGMFVRSGVRRFGGNGVMDLQAEDMNGDGRVDLVALVNDSVWMMRGRGDGAFEQALGTSFAVALAPSFALADLDGDGDADMACSAGRVLWNDGRAGFSLGPELPGGSAIAAGDLDADGDIDLALPGRILENQGRGSFLVGRNLRTNPNHLRTTDLDADGETDLATTGFGLLSVYLNRGPNAFAESQYELPSGAFQGPLIESGDFDGDGIIDLALVDPGTGATSFHPNAGGGDFHRRRALETGNFIPEIVAVDLDLDGDRDLVGLHDNLADPTWVVPLWNDGRGVFRPTASLSVAGYPGDIDAADMDGDSDPDLVLGGERGLEILINDREAGFERRREVLVAAVNLVRVLAGDLDGDGDGDIAARDMIQGRVFLALQGSDAAFELRSLEPGGGAGNFSQSRVLLPCDLEGDGDRDLLAGADASIRVLKNDGKGAFAAGAPLDAGGEPTGLAAADWDADGDLDLAASVRDCSSCTNPFCDCPIFLRFLVNEPGGSFRLASQHPVAKSSFELAAEDLDRDGDVDLVVPHTLLIGSDFFDAGSEVEVFLNRGDGAFASWGIVPTGPGSGSVTAADLDGDLYPEIALGTAAGITVIPMRVIAPRGADANRNGLIDDCEGTRFRRGDWNQDGALNIADPIGLLGHLFQGGIGTPCPGAGDADDSGRLDITDPVRILAHLFQGGPPPAEPFAVCGNDSTPDGLPCVAFAPCR